jgi:hypothetical protein
MNQSREDLVVRPAWSLTVRPARMASVADVIADSDDVLSPHFCRICEPHLIGSSSDAGYLDRDAKSRKKGLESKGRLVQDRPAAAFCGVPRAC